MKSPLALYVDTPEGPAILIAPFLDIIHAQARSWRQQESAALRAGLKQSRLEREADVCRGKAAVLEQLAKDVAEQR